MRVLCYIEGEVIGKVYSSAAIETLDNGKWVGCYWKCRPNTGFDMLIIHCLLT
jgi:hypothetical protein